MGSKTQNYELLSELFAINTSHFEVFYESFANPQNLKETQKIMVINIAFLDRNIETVMNAFTDLLSSKRIFNLMIYIIIRP